jgi:hypothetical protein
MADTPDLGAADDQANDDVNQDTDVSNDTKDDQQAQDDGATDVKPDDSDKAGDDTDQAKGYWPEDWKERYVDKQVTKDGKPLDDAAKEKLMKRLARYASPRAAMDAMIAAQNKISAGGLVKIPGKDATPEEIAQYRKEIGVPEEAKGYDLTLGDGMVVGDDDKEMVNAFLETAHAGNYTQQQVTDGLNWYYKTQEDAISARHEADVTHKAAVEEELREEWGPEYKSNINLMANYLTTDFGEGVADLITGARLADGTPLANHPDILRGFVAKARSANPLGALVPGSGTKQHDAMVAEIETLEAKMGTDGALKGKDQDRYLKLVSMRDKVPEI